MQYSVHVMERLNITGDVLPNSVCRINVPNQNCSGLFCEKLILEFMQRHKTPRIAKQHNKDKNTAGGRPSPSFQTCKAPLMKAEVLSGTSPEGRSAAACGTASRRRFRRPPSGPALDTSSMKSLATYVIVLKEKENEIYPSSLEKRAWDQEAKYGT